MNSTLQKQGQHTRIAIQAVMGYEDSNTPETPGHWSTTDIQNCLVDHRHLMSPIADWVKTQLE